MSACSGRSSETACALRAPAHSWATASTLSWTSFSLFHKPAQQHKQDPERNSPPPQTQGICFVLRTTVKKVTEIKTAHKKKKKKNYPVEHFKWPQMFRLNLPNAVELRVSHPTLAQFAGQGWGCTAPASSLSVPWLRWLWEDLHTCLKHSNWAMWDQMTVHQSINAKVNGIN